MEYYVNTSVKDYHAINKESFKIYNSLQLR